MCVEIKSIHCSCPWSRHSSGLAGTMVPMVVTPLGVCSERGEEAATVLTQEEAKQQGKLASRTGLAPGR